MTRALVQTALGLATVDVEEEETVEIDEDAQLERPRLELELPLVVAADRVGSTVVAIVARRPPLVVSHDAGRTWTEAGGGLPDGRAVAISAEHPDLMLFAGEERLFVSADGGRFWRALSVELPQITAVAWDE